MIFGPLLGEALHDPVLRVLPAVIDLSRLTHHRQAIIGERYQITGAQEEIAFPVGSDRVPGSMRPIFRSIGSLHGPRMSSAQTT